MAVDGRFGFQRADAANVEVDVVGERSGVAGDSVVDARQRLQRVRDAVMPWRSSSSVLTVLVNELACCSESLARVEVTAIVLRLLVPRCIESVVLIATAPTVIGSELAGW